MKHAVDLQADWPTRYRGRIGHLKSLLFTFLFSSYLSTPFVLMILAAAGPFIFGFAALLEVGELACDIADFARSRNRNWQQLLQIGYKVLTIGALLLAIVGSFALKASFLAITAGVGFMAGGLTPAFFVAVMAFHTVVSLAKVANHLRLAFRFRHDPELRKHHLWQAATHLRNTVTFGLLAAGITVLMLNPITGPIMLGITIATITVMAGVTAWNMAPEGKAKQFVRDVAHTIFVKPFQAIYKAIKRPAPDSSHTRTRVNDAETQPLIEMDEIKKPTPFAYRQRETEYKVDAGEFAKPHPAKYIDVTFKDDMTTSRANLTASLERYRDVLAIEKESFHLFRKYARAEKHQLAEALVTVLKITDANEGKTKLSGLISRIEGGKYSKAFRSFWHTAGSMQTFLQMTAAVVDADAPPKKDEKSLLERVQRIDGLQHNQDIKVIEEIGEAVANLRPAA